MTDEKETTDELLASRHAVYGDRIEQMQRTAKIWSGLLGVEIHDWQVPLMMSAYKMLRTFETPNYSDNSDDIFGWGKMFVEVMDANHGGIVQARTVEEYQAKLAAASEIASQAQADWFDNSAGLVDEKDFQETPAGPMSREDEIMLYGPPAARFALQEERRKAAAAEQDKRACRSCGHAPHGPGRCLDKVNDRDCLCSDGPKHPYENAERDAEVASMEAWRNREEKNREPRGS
ncbi:hypothetical protein SEA_BURRO_6 [Microbacterium phage Burro]|uniref:DUF6378 domain-containing protein n=1 Tax=Microbacterium phage Burro TaxID=2315703 RepID=A0A386KMH9_9CAUD|nr:hypothetical protein HWB89_gp06 [Microbacterium phage Burro]AYD86149.1 hypothetical protein SEA_BURRO_6 [Microbacterium phage Burro]